MRGLKLLLAFPKHQQRPVASFTDAWIETKDGKSKPVIVFVASFTDAWIETYIQLRSVKGINVASFTDAWIETLKTLLLLQKKLSHLLQMRGLKRCAISRVASTALSHLLQMRGLKP